MKKSREEERPWFEYEIFRKLPNTTGPRISIAFNTDGRPTKKLVGVDIWKMICELNQIHEEVGRAIQDEIDEEWEIWS